MTSVLILFWLVWLVLGRFVVFEIWFGHACKPGACSGILLPLFAPSLLLAVGVWIAVGIGVTMLLQRHRKAPESQGEDAFSSRLRKLVEADAALTTDELMAKYGISFDGRQYRFAGYAYDNMADALEYARIAALTSLG